MDDEFKNRWPYFEDHEIKNLVWIAQRDALLEVKHQSFCLVFNYYFDLL